MINQSDTVEAKHPEYLARQNEWTVVNDCVHGEPAIKAKGTVYLPKPEGGTMTDEDYKAYQKRALFYNVTGRTLEGLTGHVFNKLPIVNLTPRLDLIKDNIDGKGTTLDQLAKLTLSRVLGRGRGGLFVDYPRRDGEAGATVEELDKGNIRPTILDYSPFDIINWKVQSFGAVVKLVLVVLRESRPKDGQSEFANDCEVQYRVLRLNEASQYTWEIWRQGEGSEAFTLTEGPFGVTDSDGQPWEEIPFFFVGWQTNSPPVNSVPMYDLAALNLAHYRNSAEYEDSVFLVGNPQLVLAGLTREWVQEVWKNKGIRFGSRTAIMLPSGASGDLVQATPNTLAGEAMEHKERQMKALGAALVEQQVVQRTATEAGQDETARTSILSSSADNVTSAMTRALEAAGRFIGEKQSEKTDDHGKKTKSILYELSTDFDLNTMTAQDRSQLLAEYHAKAISYTELREGLKAAGVAFLDDKMALDEIEHDPFHEEIPDPNNPLTNDPAKAKDKKPPVDPAKAKDTKPPVEN